MTQHDVDFQGHSGPSEVYLSLDNSDPFKCDQHIRPFIRALVSIRDPYFLQEYEPPQNLSPLGLSDSGLKSRRISGSLIIPGEIRGWILYGRSGLAMVR